MPEHIRAPRSLKRHAFQRELFMTPVRKFALLVLLIPAAAWASDDTLPSFSVSGFGTLGVVKTNTDDAQFRYDARQPNGANKSLNLGVDSQLGVQFSSNLTRDLSATVQLVSSKTRSNDYMPDFEWAFVKYALTPDLAVRVGRIGAPIFLISDYRKIGYVNVWVRPPQEVYAQVANSYFDGADVLYKLHFGDDVLTLQPYVGQSIGRLSPQQDAKFRCMTGFNSTYERGSWTFRLGYVAANLTDQPPAAEAAINAIRHVPVPIPSIQAAWAAGADGLEIRGKFASFAGAGFIYDDGKILAQGEYARRRIDGFVEGLDGWYTTLGYRISDFTPYVSYAKVKSKHNSTIDNLPAPTPQLAAYRKAVSAVLVGADQNTSTIGLRWNAYKNLDIKIQFDHVSTSATGDGTFFTAAQPGFRGKGVNVFSLATDFVF